MKNIPVRKIKPGQKEQDTPVSFTIRDIRKLLDGNDMAQALHRHDFFLILILEKGVGKHVIDFVSYDICDNSVFFMRPGQVHEHIIKAGSTGYLMQFRPDFFYSRDKMANQLIPKVSNKNFFQLDVNKIKKLLSISNYIFEEYSEKQEGYQEIIKANLEIFFIELVRQTYNLKETQNQEKIYQQELLEEFLNLLDANISTHKKVPQYADMLSLSPYQLNAVIKATLDKTCSEIINEHIILEAKRYLLATSNQIKEIAYHLGFEDISYFIRFFRKQTGLSPEAFRQNFK